MVKETGVNSPWTILTNNDMHRIAEKAIYSYQEKLKTNNTTNNSKTTNQLENNLTINTNIYKETIKFWNTLLKDPIIQRMKQTA